MSGWPVWLASVSVTRAGELVPTDMWDARTLERVEDSVNVLLDGIGDQRRQRAFRMAITYCRHRALSQAEHDALPASWHTEPAVNLAGGPLEVLWHCGIPETPSTLPCERPGHRHLSVLTYLPLDCGECGPCLARASARAGLCACTRGPSTAPPYVVGDGG